MTTTHWWQGRRGEWFVVLQLVLFYLVAFGPHRFHGWPARAFPQHPLITTAGGILMAAGGVMILAAAARLGLKLSPLPYPVDGGVLYQTGVYRLVRHPMYSGAILMALGWTLVGRGWLTLAYAAALFVFFDLKARREERWLVATFPGYAGYRRRVRKLLPFLY